MSRHRIGRVRKVHGTGQPNKLRKLKKKIGITFRTKIFFFIFICKDLNNLAKVISISYISILKLI